MKTKTSDIMEKKESNEKTSEALPEDAPPPYEAAPDEPTPLLRDCHEGSDGVSSQNSRKELGWVRRLLAISLPNVLNRTSHEINCSPSESPTPKTTRPLEPPSSKPTKEVQIFLPDPKHVKCRCGQHKDTTISDQTLPAGRVECHCGYIVTSTGQAYYPPAASSSKSPDCTNYKCSCGTKHRRDRDHKAITTCPCGAQFHPNGSVKRLCPFHDVYALDARNVRCSCGQYVDTTLEWIVLHANGKYSSYKYPVPRGNGRCACGMTVSRDGSCVMEHRNSCCKISRQSRREIKDGGVEGRACSCASGRFCLKCSFAR